MNTNVQKKLLTALYVISVLALLPFAYISAYPSMMGLQLWSTPCGSVGTARYSPEFNAGWSSLTYGGGTTDPDCVSIYMAGTAIPNNTNIRIYMQEFDHAGGIWPATWPDSWGPSQVTGWASAGATTMPWVTEPDNYNPDAFRMYVESAAMANQTITNMRLAVQTADAGGYSSGCGGYYSSWGYTPYISQGGGWSPVVSANGSPQDMNCLRIYMEPTVLATPLPVLTATPATVAAVGATSVLNYTAVNVSSCSLTGTNGDSWTGITSGSGSRTTSPITTNTTYTITCTGNGSPRAANTTVSTPLPDMTSTIQDHTTYEQGVSTSFTYNVRTANNAAIASVGRLYFDYKRDGWDGNGVDGDFYVNTNVAALAAGANRNVSGSGTFATAGNWRVQSQADSSAVVAESNESNNYSAWDDFVVTPPNPTATFEVRNVTTGSSWVTSDLDITERDHVELRWTSTDATGGCLGGSTPGTGNFSTGGATAGTDTDIAEPAVGTSMQYTLTCTGGGGTTPAIRQIDVTSYSATPFFNVSDTSVRPGDDVTFTWNTYLNDYTACSFTGAGAPGTLPTASGTEDITIEGASTYVLQCLGGTATITVQILPQFFES